MCYGNCFDGVAKLQPSDIEISISLSGGKIELERSIPDGPHAADGEPCFADLRLQLLKTVERRQPGPIFRQQRWQVSRRNLLRRIAWTSE